MSGDGCSFILTRFLGGAFVEWAAPSVESQARGVHERRRKNSLCRCSGGNDSGGHSVAAMWQQFAQLTHQLVGCEVHGGSKTPPVERGRAIALYEIAYPSRFS